MTQEPDIVAMARAAMRDERLSDGALYGKLADEIERLKAENARLKEIEIKYDQLISGAFI